MPAQQLTKLSISCLLKIVEEKIVRARDEREVKVGGSFQLPDLSGGSVAFLLEVQGET